MKFYLVPDNCFLSQGLSFESSSLSECILFFSRKFPRRGVTVYHDFSGDANLRHLVFIKYYDFKHVKKFLSFFNKVSKTV